MAKTWTDSQVQYLKNNFINPTVTWDILCNELKRKPAAIRSKASELGLKRPYLVTAQHGTIGMRNNYNCRCPKCLAAAVNYHRKHRKERSYDSFKQHGIPSSYWNGCRCDACRAAAAAYWRLNYGKMLRQL